VGDERRRRFPFALREWAAIAFYRPPACVPDDFNLLDFFDPNAMDCPSVTVQVTLRRVVGGRDDLPQNS
jgi:hypothetical protein